MGAMGLFDRRSLRRRRRRRRPARPAAMTRQRMSRRRIRRGLRLHPASGVGGTPGAWCETCDLFKHLFKLCVPAALHHRSQLRVRVRGGINRLWKAKSLYGNNLSPANPHINPAAVNGH